VNLLEAKVNEEVILKLVQSVSALEAKVEGLQDSMSEIKSELSEVKASVNSDVHANERLMKITWAALGACIGAGGTEAIKAALTVLGG
tara:strand:+ start:895 stop:1158 length:264 start_codon:yes stop_codon:yes gene_type:complete